MSWIEVTPPAELAVPLEVVKEQCRVASNLEDNYLTLLTKAAAKVIEMKTRRIFIERDFKFYADDFPGNNEPLELPIAPIKEITSVKYWDQTGVLSEITDYNVDIKSLLGRITHDAYSFWPYVNPQYNAVEVNFVAGYGPTSESVPEEMQAAILFLVAHWYTNREPVAVGTAVLANKIPFTLQYVINSFKIMSI